MLLVADRLGADSLVAAGRYTGVMQTPEDHPASDFARLIPSASYRRGRWKNGAGWTREIHAEPVASPGEGADAGDAGADRGVAAEEWSWRLSIAEIEQDGPFSVFPGVDRELVLLQGHGLRLRFEDGAEHVLVPPFQRLRFAGERGVVGELTDGRTEDFNVMWRRDRVETCVLHRPLVGAMVVFADPGQTWVIHLLAGQARVSGSAGFEVSAGDTVLLRAGEQRQRHVLDGGGEALLIRIDPLP